MVRERGGGPGPGSRAGLFGPELASNDWKSGCQHVEMKDLRILVRMHQFPAIFIISGRVSDRFLFFSGFWCLVSSGWEGFRALARLTLSLLWYFLETITISSSLEPFQPLRTIPAVRNLLQPLGTFSSCCW